MFGVVRWMVKDVCGMYGENEFVVGIWVVG